VVLGKALSSVIQYYANDASKSQLAIRYAYSMLETVPQRFVFWVAASTSARFEQAYRNLADKPLLPGRIDPEVDVLRMVRDWLCDEENGPWTMVLDGVDALGVFFPSEVEADAQAYIRTGHSAHTFPTRNGTILITSRSKDVAYRLVGAYSLICEVPPMLEREGLQLLHNKLGNATSGSSTAELLEVWATSPLLSTKLLPTSVDVRI
jgi:hypothetical protein